MPFIGWDSPDDRGRQYGVGLRDVMAPPVHPELRLSAFKPQSCAVVGKARSGRRKEPTVASAVLNIAPEGNLSRYLQEIRKFPMLPPEEELSLSKRWRDTEDMEAAHKLVTSHLRLVAKIAMGYRGYGLPVGELISEGNVGMMQAVKRFDPDRGFRLATYAMWWIRAAIQEYILHSWSLVKMGTTAAQKKLFFNLRRLRARCRRSTTATCSPSRWPRSPASGRAGAGRRQHEPPPRRAGPQPERPGSRRTAKASGRIGWSTKPKARRARSPIARS